MKFEPPVNQMHSLKRLSWVPNFLNFHSSSVEHLMTSVIIQLEGCQKNMNFPFWQFVHSNHKWGMRLWRLDDFFPGGMSSLRDWKTPGESVSMFWFEFLSTFTSCCWWFLLFFFKISIREKDKLAQTSVATEGKWNECRKKKRVNKEKWWKNRSDVQIERSRKSV